MSAPDENGLRAEVSPDLCVGVGMCLLLAPGAFAKNPAGQSEFAPGGAFSDDDLREAAEGCPMSAIALHRPTGRTGT